MKKIFIICFILFFLCRPGFSRDFIVKFIEENYNETQVPFSNDPLVYHSIQVNSIAGSKILVLTGNDYNYRKWLRHYIAENKEFIAKIPDDRTDEFISSKAYKIDVTSLHPMDGARWKQNESRKGVDKEMIEGDNNILIVDPNDKRTDLIQSIVIRMGYKTIIFKAGKKALDFFELQPDKFKMIIAQHLVNGMPSDEFVEQVLKIDHKVPILIDTGYGNLAVKNELLSRFSGFGSVHLKPVILRELEKTIASIIKKNV
jgi:CheY-like chemotaxis protein